MSYAAKNYPYFLRNIVYCRMPYRVGTPSTLVNGSMYVKEKCDHCGGYKISKVLKNHVEETNLYCLACYDHWNKSLIRHRHIRRYNRKYEDFGF